jgi:c(7)-type cytochrome triheme protein
LGLVIAFGCTKAQEESAPTAAQKPPAATAEPADSLPTESVLPPPGSALTKLDIRPTGVALSVGDSQQLNGVGLAPDQTERKDLLVTWASENPSVVTVSPEGVVTAVAPGSAVITAFAEGKTASVTVTVAASQITGIKIGALTTKIATGETQKLELVGLDEKKRAVGGVGEAVWSSSNPKVASVDPSGLVTAHGPGKTVVTAKALGKAASISLSITAPSLAKLELEPQKLKLDPGDTLQVKYSAVDVKNNVRTDLALSWNSSSPAVATVGANGMITAMGPGTATISVSAEGKTASTQVTVNTPKIAKIELRPATATVPVGQAHQFQIMITDAKGRELKNLQPTWTLKNPNVASINATGIATGLLEGTTTVTATLGKVTSNAATLTVAKTAAAEIAPPAGTSTREQLRAKYKNVDPSQLIYLSGITGELAGTGDPGGVAGEAEKAGLSQHPQALELAQLPKDQYGLVDWASALKNGKVKPRDSIDPKGGPSEPPLDLDIVIKAKSDFQPDVVFPHLIHTMWLDCGNCHDAIFKKKAGGHPEMTMPKITAGEYCGRCHNRVAFPLSDCLRCHTKPKEGATPAAAP